MILRKYRRRYPDKEWETIKTIVKEIGGFNADKDIDSLRKAFEFIDEYYHTNKSTHVGEFNIGELAASFVFNETYFPNPYKVSHEAYWREKQQRKWILLNQSLIDEIEVKIWGNEARAKFPERCRGNKWIQS